MDYLKHANRVCAGAHPEPELDAGGRRVVVLGGGDTGADCVATAHRQGAVEVMQISINEQPPQEADVRMARPWAPQIYRRSYAQAEGGQEVFSINMLSFVDTDGRGRVGALRAERVEWQREDGERTGKRVTEPDMQIPADLVILAVGFAGAEAMALEDFGIALSARGIIYTDTRLAINLDGVFAAGDACLPSSLASHHPPLYPQHRGR